MSDYIERERAKRNTYWLDPHEMTTHELRKEHSASMKHYHRYLEMAEHYRARAALMSAQLSKPIKMKVFEGGGKTKPRNKICRIHEWDLETNTRIRGHKHDWRMPSYKGDKT